MRFAAMDEAVAGAMGSRLGPVFATKDRRAYIKVRKDDSVRAVVDLSTMTLVDYATPEQYPDEPVRCDRSLFVPIFCKECYGTHDAQYNGALQAIKSSGADTFIVGMCSVYGVASGEIYPDSRLEYIVPNDLSFSGACHPQPGRALFMHKTEKEIGSVKCYWHVHSQSTNKTFLYCCVARADTEYAAGVVQPETSTGFSLGTVGDNAKGPVTEECSLVSWPMRPGCFCVVVSAKDLPSTMTRMGFSCSKDAALDAGEKPLGLSTTLCAPETLTSAERVGQQDAEALRKMVADQTAEMRLLKDALEAVKVQNNLFTRLLRGPDEDALFTLRGAREFSRRTGTGTKLCAGDTTDEKPLDREPEQTSDARNAGEMAATQSQVDEILKLLQNQHRQQQPPQQQQDMQHAQLYAFHNQTQPNPVYLPYPAAVQPHNPTAFHRRYGDAGLPDANPKAAFPRSESPMDYDSLTQEQRRKIAMAYNREEAEKQAVAQKEQERMLESIKASIKDALKDQMSKSASTESQSEQYDTLRMLAKDTPYKRVNHTRSSESTDDDNDVAGLLRELRELRELTKELSARRAVVADKPKTNLGNPNTANQNRSPDNQTVAMEAENTSQAAQSAVVGDHSLVTAKQQAGYASVAQASAGRSTGDSVSDFISAVVSKH